MNNQELIKEIENLDINDRPKPSYIEFYIQYYSEEISYLQNLNKEYEMDISFFKTFKMRNVSDSELVNLFLKPIKLLEERIKNNNELIKNHQENLKQFIKCHDSYLEDFKKGIYYDKLTGDILEGVNGAVPDDAYIPKEKK